MKHNSIVTSAAKAVIMGIIIILAFTSCTVPDLSSDSSTPSTTSLDAGVSANAPVESEPSEVVEEEPDANLTTGQKNVLKSAKNYLSFMAFSRDGLISQLEFEGYENADAVYAADNCGADWNEQAVLKAKNYLDTMAFSYSGMVEQLEFEKFTHEQAEYGADNCGADWNEQAALKAKSYLDLMPFSHDSLVTQLEFDGFTEEQAEYGAKQNGY